MYHSSLLTLIVFFSLSCSNESQLAELCETERTKYDNTVFDGTATYCYELPLDTLQTTYEDVEVFVDFYNVDSISIEINYLDPLIDSYVISDHYICKDPEELDEIDFHFDNENYSGFLSSDLELLHINYESNTCEFNSVTVLLR